MDPAEEDSKPLAYRPGLVNAAGQIANPIRLSQHCICTFGSLEQFILVTKFWWIALLQSRTRASNLGGDHPPQKVIEFGLAHQFMQLQQRLLDTWYWFLCRCSSCLVLLTSARSAMTSSTSNPNLRTKRSQLVQESVSGICQRLTLPMQSVWKAQFSHL